MEAGTVVSGVAVLVSGWAVWVGSRRLKLERELADRTDAREVLARAARQLWAMKQEMRSQFGVLAKGLRSGEWPEDCEKRIGSLEERRDAVERELDVLCIRFPADGKVAVPYRAAWKAVVALIGIYMTTADGPGNPSELKIANNINDDFDSARRAFLSAAQKMVGASLGDEKFVGGNLAGEL